MNEAEVRFHIVDPILRRLGYGRVFGTYLFLEHKLEYPYYHIGRRSKRDVPLGFPDYRCGLDGRRGSFIVEAKEQDHEIDLKDREQAHSYAAHAQVGANYFILCNGRSFEIYETLSSNSLEPIISINCDRVEEEFHEIENIISVRALEKRCHVTYEKGLKLSEEIGPRASVHGGTYEVDDLNIKIFGENERANQIIKNIPQLAELDNLKAILKEFVYTVESGTVVRDDNGRIAAKIRFGSVTKNNRESMKILGLDAMEFFARDKFISSDTSSPTIFEAERKIFVTKGSTMFPLFGSAQTIETDINVDAFVSTKLSYNNEGISGEFGAYAEYKADFPFIGKITAEMDLFGHCDIRISV